MQSHASATPLQAFAAGAALCSTSLGTTFTILNTSGLTNTRLGTVLTSAAMMDDVVGLVLVQVISELGSDSSSIRPIIVVRPIAVSIGMVLLILLTCRYLVKPVFSLVRGRDSSAVMRIVRKQPGEAMLIAHTVLLFGLVAAASYAVPQICLQLTWPVLQSAGMIPKLLNETRLRRTSLSRQFSRRQHHQCSKLTTMNVILLILRSQLPLRREQTQANRLIRYRSKSRLDSTLR